MLNNDKGSKADSNHDILTLEKDQHVLTEIKICLENNHATFTNNQNMFGEQSCYLH